MAAGEIVGDARLQRRQRQIGDVGQERPAALARR